MTVASHHSSARTRRMTIIGLLANLSLGLIKLVVGIVGHSGALIADAIESLADIGGSIVIWSGLAIGAMPADEDHPYGHGKAEALAGLVVSGLVFAAAISIGVKAVHDIRTPHENPAPFTLLVLLIVFPIKLGLYLAARRVARQEGSGVVEVDAGHHVMDAITSVAAAIGISIAIFGSRVIRHSVAESSWLANPSIRWETADDWAALFAAAIILFNAWGLAKIPLRELMDTSTPEDEQRVINPAREIARSVQGVRDIEKIHARKSGGGYWLDMHVQVDAQMPVRDAHAIGGTVRARIRKDMPQVRDVLVHIEPHEPMNP
ncbi:MAG TPA: cation diffusion facilitator family transporter [Phycisphaerales bacterium]|nr:cation diffusion facilitator family transporter [Phycisphaerales bacterium]